MKCSLCGGNKKITGFGMIPGATCYLCKGEGFLPAKIEIEETEGSEEEIEWVIDDEEKPKTEKPIMHKNVRNGRGGRRRV